MAENDNIRNLQLARRRTRASEGISAVQEIADDSSQQAADIASAVAASFDVTYYFPAVDFGAGDSTEVIATPAGFTGRVKSVAVYNVSEAFTDDTTEARVDVGDGVDADAYALSGDLGTTAIGAAAAPAVTQGATGEIPASSDVTITFVAPTGGTPAGIGDVAVTIKFTPE